ncbi:MAG: hypothetical protein BWY96_01097 [Spirochaetes bacterium ADurb.BinA120]|nr:MAG: hypothetical protein BWY96_01097 [Spirochaetes bacterium ADurb.BinA120]
MMSTRPAGPYRLTSAGVNVVGSSTCVKVTSTCSTCPCSVPAGRCSMTAKSLAVSSNCPAKTSWTASPFVPSASWFMALDDRSWMAGPTRRA